MKKQLLAMALVLASGTAFAGDHDHDEFPEGTLLALEGQDAISKEECFLFVTDVGYTGPEQRPDQFFAKVQTNYVHGHDAPAAISVRLHPDRADVLTGLGPNGKDQIAIFLDPATLDLRNAKSFSLKWLHGSHFHTNRCVNLVVHEHAH